MHPQGPSQRHRKSSSTRRATHHHPRPLINFTIPSIHDDTVLDCRIYHPSHRYSRREDVETSSEAQTESAHAVNDQTKVHMNAGLKAAIIAHPYAPLGGCQDDPVVMSCSETLLAQGFIVATFDFRGAGGSKGKTSWTARAEVGDYASVVGLLVHYLSALAKGRTKGGSHSREKGSAGLEITLVLGGYSYGSLVVSMLSPIAQIMDAFQDAKEGTTRAEIKLRATRMAGETLKLEAEAEIMRGERRGRERSSPGDMRGAQVAMGGEETAADVRMKSQEHSGRLSLEHARRSMDKVPKLMRRAAKRMGSGRSEKGESEEEDEGSGAEGEHDRMSGVVSRDPNSVVYARYLLISPLLPPLSGFLNLSWSSMLPHRLKSEGELGKVLFSTHPTLAIFGSDDGFTSGDRLVSWAKRMQDGSTNPTQSQADRASRHRFEWLLVEDAGHFWREDGVEETMKTRIERWVDESGDF